MPEILTESFCERCGTRFTFEAAAPTRSRLSRLKIIARGLRNYVLSDDTTLDEAFADARSDEERAISTQQLEAFHKTFNFCLSCRQYTCANCWNGVEGRCLTCAPNLSREPLPAAFPGLDARVEPIRPAVELGGDGNAAWPAHDLATEATGRSAGVEDHPPIPEVALAPDLGVARAVAPGPEAAPQVEGSSQPSRAETAPSPDLAETVPAPASAPAAPRRGVQERIVSPADRATTAAEQTAALLARFRPPFAESAETKPVRTETAPAPTERGPEPSAALPPSAGPPAAPQPQPPVAPPPAASLPSPETRPPEATRPEIPAAPPGAPTDRVSQPLWPPPHPAATPAPPPAWPPPHVAAPPAGHALAAEAVWRESSRDVLAPRTGSVQACIACGLPLSATARFCRRCGSPQQPA